MELQEIDDIITDVNEAFEDLGTISKAPNILWKRRVVNSPDFVYYREANYKKEYEDFEMTVLSLGKPTSRELLDEGLDDRDTEKMYFAGSQFTQYDDEESGFKLRPDEADRVFYRDIVFDVVKIKPTRVSDKEIMYTIYITQAELPYQSEEYREEADPYFEIDSSQEIESGNDTGANDNLIVDYPATIETATGPWVIGASNNKLYFRIDPEVEEFNTIEITPGVYTPSSLAPLLSMEGLIFEPGDGNILITTEAMGTDSYLEVLYGENNAYIALGIEVGLYQGSSKMRGL